MNKFHIASSNYLKIQGTLDEIKTKIIVDYLSEFRDITSEDNPCWGFLGSPSVVYLCNSEVARSLLFEKKTNRRGTKPSTNMDSIAMNIYNTMEKTT